ncbi:GNAT family N-acetyltransferase [Altererythrobacter sp. C41]|uniref:GNAT family N-acetyltransferase n=1 Tax=Altererythrobacter sp. C41 TaxID=2806021 RepID=UPI0019339BE8|nr:GNAT family N-acetyltransferase [Altererythrobacter sp. C41]MBM0168524.1 GNAT family N-acetyltransferase [Altererythrobacter sp. C41]
MTDELEQARWRTMTVKDLPAVVRIAACVHPDYPEEEPVFAERLTLFPEGCRLLVDDGEALGYLISHPWTRKAPPALDTRLGELPGCADTYYIHDLALMPRGRGKGLAIEAVASAVTIARMRGFATLSLVAVGNSAEFWQAQGFAVVHDADVERSLASYGGAAHYMERAI